MDFLLYGIICSVIYFIIILNELSLDLNYIDIVDRKSEIESFSPSADFAWGQYKDIYLYIYIYIYMRDSLMIRWGETLVGEFRFAI